MKVLMINSVCGIGSTGRICTDIAERLQADGHDCMIAYGRGNVPEQYRKYAIKIGNKLNVCFHGARARVLDNVGFESKYATEMLINKIEEYNPDVIHLHNLHGYYINIETLFTYLKESKKPVVWTLHDCWAFTGHCVHFSAIGCPKWRDGCHHCPQKREYPWSFFDHSEENYRRKRKLFTALDNMILVTPSKWLASQVQESFLGSYPLKPIYNGVDCSVFHNSPSELRCRYNLEKQRIALGVANIWDERKGLTYMIQLSKLLENSWTVVLIGVTHKQIEQLPPNIIGIQRTENLQELAAWYSLADVYVNTSAEETMGMTTAEAISCGTPVVAFNTTATPEIVGGNGITVKYGNIRELSTAIQRIIVEGRENFQVDCNRFALEKQYKEYLNLYQQIETKITLLRREPATEVQRMYANP